MIVHLLEPVMAKKTPAPAPSQGNEPPLDTETVRVTIDVMEMLRDIRHHARNEQNKRPTMIQVVDKILRPAVLREYQELQKRIAAAQAKEKKD